MLKCVVFDMDGTLLDTERLAVQFWVDMAEEYGVDTIRTKLHGFHVLISDVAILHVLYRFYDFGERTVSPHSKMRPTRPPNTTDREHFPLGTYFAAFFSA